MKQRFVLLHLFTDLKKEKEQKKITDFKIVHVEFHSVWASTILFKKQKTQFKSKVNENAERCSGERGRHDFV